MESREFKELLEGARQVGKVLGVVFEGMTEEDLDLASAIRHYPLVVLGAAVGVGAVAGWWIARKSEPPAQLPPPKPAHPLDSLENWVRDVLPPVVADEATAAARNWVDHVLEPKLKQGLENVASNVPENGLGSLLRGVIRRMDENS